MTGEASVLNEWLLSEWARVKEQVIELERRLAKGESESQHFLSKWSEEAERSKRLLSIGWGLIDILEMIVYELQRQGVSLPQEVSDRVETIIADWRQTL